MKPVSNETLIEHINPRPWYGERATAYVAAQARAFGRAVDTDYGECHRYLNEAATLLAHAETLLGGAGTDTRALARAGQQALALRRRVLSLLEEFRRGPLRYQVPSGPLLDAAEAPCRDLLSLHQHRYESTVRAPLEQCAACLDRFIDSCKSQLKGESDHG